MKKKGFTLIELLAVILILAIIAVIVTPIISKIIDEAKAQSDKRSAEKYVRAAQTFYMESQMDENKRAVLGTNIIDRLDLENVRSNGTVVAYPDGTVEMAIVIGSRCFTKTTTQDIIDIQMSKDTQNCYVASGSAVISSIDSGDSSIVITIDNSADTSVTMTSCKYGTEAGNFNLDGTISGNTCTLAPTTVGIRYYYVIKFSDDSSKSGSVQGGSGVITPTPNNGGGSYAGGSGANGGTGSGGSGNENNGSGNNGSGNGGSGNGGSGSGGVAGPVTTDDEGQTTYDGRYLANVKKIYWDVTNGVKCSITEWSANNGNTTNSMSTGCIRFWAYMEDNLSYTAIMDRNIIGGIAWNTSNNNGAGPVTALAILKTNTNNWQGTITPKNYTRVFEINGDVGAYEIKYDTDGYKARFITSNEVANIVSNTNFNSVSATTDDWFYLDGYAAVQSGATWQTQMATESQPSAFTWLYNYLANSQKFGATAFADATSNAGYWTSDSIAGTISNAWIVSNSGRLSYGVRRTGNSDALVTVNRSGEIGIRPVITVLKSAVD